jgi:hypothetical protein
MIVVSRTAIRWAEAITASGSQPRFRGDATAVAGLAVGVAGRTADSYTIRSYLIKIRPDLNYFPR